MTLGWVANVEPDLAGYNVYRSDIPGGPFEKLNDKLLKTSNFVDTGGPAGVPAYYEVSAVNTTGNESAASAVVTGFRPDAVPPAAPSGPVARYVHGVVNVTWQGNAEPDLVGYNVYRSQTGDGGYVKINPSLLSLPQGLDSTPGGKKAWYAVEAVDASGNASPLSLAVSPGHHGTKSPGAVGAVPQLAAVVNAALPPAVVGGAKAKASVTVTVANQGGATQSGPDRVQAVHVGRRHARRGRRPGVRADQESHAQAGPEQEGQAEAAEVPGRRRRRLPAAGGDDRPAATRRPSSRRPTRSVSPRRS